ncbi:hypothetical protein LTR27_007211 [Elasticomyces elasticus]|nr:hypothetical protein LTR27_007211 [Elasticomyces elasticus]
MYSSRILIARLFGVLAHGLSHGSDPGQYPAKPSRKCTPDAFSALLPPGGSVLYTQIVPANGTFTDASANATAQNLGAPNTYPGLPALCAVKFTLPTPGNSSIDIALFLPDSWNERFMAVGNGGVSGSISWSEMVSQSHYDFAVMSTNTGHYSGAVDGSWAVNNPEARTNWFYRAMHISVVASKSIVNAYYGDDLQYSYFSSCSNGGRQGLKELTEFPEDFDGIIAGAPAWEISTLFLWMYEMALPNSRASLPDQISNELFETFRHEAIRQCDPQDGVEDGIIADPYGCHFIPEALLCNGTAPANNASCFSVPQLSILYSLLNDWVDVNQTFVHSRLALGSDYSTLVYGKAPYGSLFLENFVYNTTNYTASDFGFYDTVQFVESLNLAIAVEPTVDALQAKGGKLLMYHGLADQLIPPGDSMLFHSLVQQDMAARGLSVDDWFRMYLVPGMEHCAATNQDAPWYFAQSGAAEGVAGAVYSTPGYRDAKHDIVLALMEWVERDVAPNEIVATKWYNDAVVRGVEKQRPTCPYPAQAVYAGHGDVDVADSWRCE